MYLFEVDINQNYMEITYIISEVLLEEYQPDSRRET